MHGDVLVLDRHHGQAGLDVTWQLDRGIVEFGPRATLALQSARRVQVYEFRDLRLESPTVSSRGGTRRLRPVDVASDLARMISEPCEPRAFEPEPEPGGPDKRRTPHQAPSGTSSNPRQQLNTTATRNLDPDLGPIFIRGRWTTLQVKDTLLVVTARDFVHRAIGGYRRPIPPH